MALDVNTPRGQLTLIEEDKCARLFERRNPGVQYVATPKDSACRVDAVLSTGARMLAVVEQKSRFDVTLAQFKAPPPNGYGNEWLVTYSKLVAAREYAKEYAMPLYGFLWIVKDRALLVQRLTGRMGEWIANFRVQRTRTQATVNGGSAVRDNAFIDMTGCTVHHDDQPSADAPQVAPPKVVQSDAAWLAEYDATGAREWGAAW